MLAIQFMISLIPLLIMNLFIKENNKWIRILNLTFYYIIAWIFLAIYDVFIKLALQIVCSAFPIINSSVILLPFIQQFFWNGLPEEITKYTVIKMTKPKNQIEILKNAMFISVIFMFYENYSYAKNGISIGIFRTILPIHILSQLIMSYFMIKAYDEKEKNSKTYKIFSIASVAIPVIIHTTYNWYLNICNNAWIKGIMIVSLGIITYIMAFTFIRKIMKKYSDEVVDNQTEISKIKIVIIVLFTIFWIHTFML